MNEERMLQILLAPQMSEKALRLSAERQYVFKVLTDATKPEIKTAVEKLFTVEVKTFASSMCTRLKEIFATAQAPSRRGKSVCHVEAWLQHWRTRCGVKGREQWPLLRQNRLLQADGA